MSEPIKPSSELDWATITLAKAAEQLRDNKPVQAYILVMEAKMRVEDFLRKNRAKPIHERQAEHRHPT